MKAFQPASRGVAWIISGLGPRICLALEDGAGAAGAGADAGAAAAGAGGAAAAPANLAAAAAAAAGAGGSSPPANGQASGAAGADPSAAYRPEGLPEHLAGASERETLDKVFKAYDGFRRAESERGTVPKEPKDYAFTPADEIKDFTGDLQKDGFFQKVLSHAHAAGLSDKQVNGFFNGMMKDLVEAGAVEKPVNFDVEIDALIPLEAKGLDTAGQKAAASRRIADNLAWIKGAEAQGNLDAEVATYLSAQLADTALGHRAIEFMRKLGDQAGPALGGDGAGAGGATEADYDRLLGDERQNSNDPKVKQTWAAEKQALAKRLWGTAPRA
jgi:hypothetical protein